jgi:hypothetical protein
MLIWKKHGIVLVFQKMQGTNTESHKRGKTAIDAAHAGIAKEEESKVSAKIVEIYGVQGEEAAEIHANYHAERISSMLEKRARENGMAAEALAQKVEQLDVQGAAFQVARGELAEPAAIDILFRNLYMIESQGGDNDRYINFYG